MRMPTVLTAYWDRYVRRCKLTEADQAYFAIRLAVLAAGALWVAGRHFGLQSLPRVDYLPVIFTVALLYCLTRDLVVWFFAPRLAHMPEAEKRFARAIDHVAYIVPMGLVTALCYFSRDPLSPCVALFLWVVAVAAVTWGFWPGAISAAACTGVIGLIAWWYSNVGWPSLPGDIALIGFASLGFVAIISVLQQQRGVEQRKSEIEQRRREKEQAKREALRERHEEIERITREALAEMGHLMRPLGEGQDASFVFEAALAITLESTLELAKTKRGYICTIDEANRRPVARIFPKKRPASVSADYPKGCLDTEHMHGAGIVTHVFKTGEPYCVNSGLVDDVHYRRVWTTPESKSELAVPICLDGLVIAVLNVEHLEENAFTPEVRRAVEHFAESVSHVLSFATQWDELRVLHDLSPKLRPGRGLQECLAQISDVLRQYGHYRVVCIWLYDESRDVLVLKRHLGLDEVVHEMNPILPVDRTMAGKAHRSSELHFVPDITTHDYPAQSLNGPMSAAYLPLRDVTDDGEMCIGVMGFYTDKREVLPDEEARFLMTIAGITQRAVVVARRSQELRAYRDIIKALADASTSLDRLLTVATEEAQRILDAEACTILLVDSTTKPPRLLPTTAAGLAGSTWEELDYRLGDGSITDGVAQTRKPFMTADIGREKGLNRHRLEQMKKCIGSGNIKAWLAVPIVSSDRERLLGVVKLLNKRPGGHIDWFGVVDQKILELIAQQISLAMETGEWWRAILDSIGEEVMVLDKDYNIVFVNRAKLDRYRDFNITIGEKCWKYWPNVHGFRLTAKRLKLMETKGLPSLIAKAIEHANDRVFPTLAELDEELAEHLSPEELARYRSLIHSVVPREPPQDEPCVQCPSRITLEKGEPKHGVAWEWNNQASVLTTEMLPGMPGRPGPHVVEVCSPTTERRTVADASLRLQKATTEDEVTDILLDTITGEDGHPHDSTTVPTLGLPRSRLYLLDDHGGPLVSRKCRGMSPEFKARFEAGARCLPEDTKETAHRLAIERNMPLLVKYDPDFPTLLEPQYDERGLEFVSLKRMERDDELGVGPGDERLDLPLRVGDTGLGKVSIDYVSPENSGQHDGESSHDGGGPKRFDASLLDILSMLVAHAAQAILNVRQTGIVGRDAAIVLHNVKGRAAAIRNYACLIEEGGCVDAVCRGDLQEIKELAEANQTDAETAIFALKPPDRKLDPVPGEKVIQLLKAARRLAKASDATLVVTGESMLRGLWVHMARDHLRRVLTCLLENSLDELATSQPDAPHITVDAHASAQRLRLTWQDNGSGVHTEPVDSILKPYETTKQRHVGLGLSMVRFILTGHGGEISVESPPNQGARFLVELPCSTKRPSEQRHARCTERGVGDECLR